MKSIPNPFLRYSIALAASSAFLSMGTALAATYDWTGATDSNFTNGANWVGGSWAQWSDYTFGSNATSGTVNINGEFGMNSLTLASGLTHNIIIGSDISQPFIMGVGVVDNPSALISIDTASRDLTINTNFIAINAVTWDVGANRTLTLNGPLNNWFNPAAIVKDGAGNAVLNQLSNYTGGTTVNGGSLSLPNGDWQTGQPWDGSGATGAITVGLGATLSTSDGVTQIKNGLTLNGGTVSSRGNLYGTGNNTWGNLLLSSNITAGNSATSLISSEIRLDADRSMDVDAGSTLNISGGIAISPNYNGGSSNYGITKTGGGTLTLTAANSYTGTTTVSGGTISLGNGTTNSNLADGATVNIAFDTTVNLNFPGTDAVGKLIIDGETVPGGIYDSSLATPLPYRSYFTGSGSLTVVNQSGTWTSTVDGNWGDSANWLSNLIATGADKTATFSAGTGSEAITVTLDSNRDIANLAFSNANYTITGNTLTLDSSTLSTLSVASGNTATISSALAGTPDVDKTGDGTLTLSGGLNYSGATTVSAGILILQDTVGAAGSNFNGSNFNINGASTLRVSGLRYNFSGEIFTFDSVGGGTLDAIASGAGGMVFMGNNTFATSGGAQNIISGTKSGNEGFNLNGQTAIFEVVTGSDATSDLKVTGTLWNGGSVIKNGAGRIEISAPQQYAGDTTVNEGSLILGDGTNNVDLSNSHDVVIESGTTLQLNYLVGNTDDIDELWLGGVQQNIGTYGAGTYSGVTVTGTGLLNVLTGPPIADPFLAWIDSFFPGETDPLIIGATADPDNDGIENLVEYVLKNGDPDASSTGILPTLNATGANFVFTYLRRTAATGTTQTFQYGNDLSGWTDVLVINGGIVSITSPEAGIEQVVITVAKGAETKLFGRLQVVK